MRSKLLVIVTAVLLFGVGIAVYAYNSTTTNAETTAASCCGDSCPMKKAGAKTTGETAHECCCKGDSCPMLAKDAKHGEKMAMAANGEHSCPMMAEKKDGMAGHDMKMANGESCPMMKEGKDAKMSEVHKGMAGMDHKDQAKSGDSCSCACCNHNKEKKVTTDTGAI
ncbi:MAG: hypothetical protein ABL999_03985 [Pyrinomonadaceae bacterium]